MKLKYSHPAITKFDLNKFYSLNELKQQLSLEQIKMFFTPIDFTWEQLENPKKKRETIEFGNEEIIGEN
jgi:hypothetical protein